MAILMQVFVLSQRVADVDRWSRSQLGEETVLLRELFEEEGHIFVQGMFVELGALDGMGLSNTRTLQYALDWSGVLIEACPGHWPRLALRASKLSRHQNVTVVQSAVCHPKPPGGTIRFSAKCRPGSAIHDGITHGDILMQKERARETDEPIDVPCDGLGNILESHGVSHVDMLSIDVEGYEVPLLQSIHWDKISVYAIVIEIDHNAPHEVDEIHTILSSAGFELVGLLAGDAIWVRPSALENSAGHWVKGNVTGTGWIGQQKHPLVRPGLGLKPAFRALHARRDALNMTTGFLRYVERVTLSLPLRGRVPPNLQLPPRPGGVIRGRAGGRGTRLDARTE